MHLKGSFDRRRWTWRLMVIEAALWLVLSGLALRVLPFRRLVPWLGRPGQGVPLEIPELRDDQCRRGLAIGGAITRASQLLPWHPVCLPQAMAAKAMLARRGLGASVHFGARMDGDRRDLTAHAWVMCGPVAVVGGRERARFVELGRFG
jgi:hypothetical protein